jgi:hypothetical protein
MNQEIVKKTINTILGILIGMAIALLIVLLIPSFTYWTNPIELIKNACDVDYIMTRAIMLIGGVVGGIVGNAKVVYYVAKRKN